MRFLSDLSEIATLDETKFSRREALVGSLMAGTALMGLRFGPDMEEARFRRRIADVERRHGGRLGVAVLDTATMKMWAHRGDERFPMCSTFKVLAAACVLHRVDQGKESLDRRVIYTKDHLVPYSPVTERHVGKPGLTVAQICKAAVTQSDNAAANLMLDGFGGPVALTAYLRSLGDGTTRLDRREPDLNEEKPGDPRDTTTPRAMARTLHRLAVGNALSASSRARLMEWLVACETGDRRLRAGTPKGWRVGDKTGTGIHHATNDVAVLWPPHRPPLVVAAYYGGGKPSSKDREAALAEVARIATTP